MPPASEATGMAKSSDEQDIIGICPKGTKGEVLELGGLLIALPAQPPKKEISGYGRADHLQLWERIPMPEELSRIKSMDEWGRCQGSLDRSFLRISKRSFAVGVKAFGFTIMGSLHILRVGTT